MNRASGRRTRRTWLPGAAVALAAAAATVGTLAIATGAGATMEPPRAESATRPLYRDGPPPGHTGGFGEPLCTECHFGGPVNDSAGALTLAAPAGFEPGATYELEVTLAHPELAAAGFQMAVRFAAGSRAGEQAGRLDAGTHGVAVTADTASGVLYAHQSATGAVQDSNTARWVVRWTAPDTATAVVIHVAANAANDDASEFGDFVYATERTVRPDR